MPSALREVAGGLVRLKTIVFAFGVLMPEIDFASPLPYAVEALDHVEVEPVLGPVLRPREPLDRVLDVLRGDLAVHGRAELDAVLEVERPRLPAVRRLRDRRRQVRHGRCCRRGRRRGCTRPAFAREGSSRSRCRSRGTRRSGRSCRSSRTSTPSRRGRCRPSALLRLSLGSADAAETEAAVERDDAQERSDRQPHPPLRWLNSHLPSFPRSQAGLTQWMPASG